MRINFIFSAGHKNIIKSHTHIHIFKKDYEEVGRHRGMRANKHTRIGSNTHEKVET